MSGEPSCGDKCCKRLTDCCNYTCCIYCLVEDWRIGRPKITNGTTKSGTEIVVIIVVATIVVAKMEVRLSTVADGHFPRSTQPAPMDVGGAYFGSCLVVCLVV
jgi:hypothetical protein